MRSFGTGNELIAQRRERSECVNGNAIDNSVIPACPGSSSKYATQCKEGPGQAGTTEMLIHILLSLPPRDISLHGIGVERSYPRCNRRRARTEHSVLEHFIRW